MTFAPATLQNLRSYLVGQGAPVLGIVGNPLTHKRGYHIGSPLLAGDYSGLTTRDKAGLSGAASAIDIGRFDRLPELGRHLIATKPYDIREVIAERADGSHAWRWDVLTGRITGDPRIDEFHHLHVSYFRDSEHRTKLPPYQAFFQPPLEDEMIYTIKGVPWPFACTVMAGTPYYSSPSDTTPAPNLLDDPTRPFMVVGESETGHRRAIYGRMQTDADRAVIGWVESTRIVR